MVMRQPGAGIEEETLAGFRTVDLYDYGGDGRRVASRERGRSKYALGYVLLCLYYDNHHGVDEAFPA